MQARNAHPDGQPGRRRTLSSDQPFQGFSGAGVNIVMRANQGGSQSARHRGRARSGSQSTVTSNIHMPENSPLQLASHLRESPTVSFANAVDAGAWADPAEVDNLQNTAVGGSSGSALQQTDKAGSFSLTPFNADADSGEPMLLSQLEAQHSVSTSRTPTRANAAAVENSGADTAGAGGSGSSGRPKSMSPLEPDAEPRVSQRMISPAGVQPNFEMSASSPDTSQGQQWDSPRSRPSPVPSSGLGEATENAKED